MIAILMELVGGHSFVNAGLNTFPFSPGSSGCCGDGPYLKEQEFFSISNSAEGGCGRQPAGSARVLFVFGRSFEIPQGNYTGPFSPLCASRSIGFGTVKREMVSLLLKDFY